MGPVLMVCDVETDWGVGLGRTGLAIACYLVYGLNMEGNKVSECRFFSDTTEVELTLHDSRLSNSSVNNGKLPFPRQQPNPQLTKANQDHFQSKPANKHSSSSNSKNTSNPSKSISPASVPALLQNTPRWNWNCLIPML